MSEKEFEIDVDERIGKNLEDIEDVIEHLRSELKKAEEDEEYPWFYATLKNEEGIEVGLLYDGGLFSVSGAFEDNNQFSKEEIENSNVFNKAFEIIRRSSSDLECVKQLPRQKRSFLFRPEKLRSDIDISSRIKVPFEYDA